MKTAPPGGDPVIALRATVEPCEYSFRGYVERIIFGSRDLRSRDPGVRS
jgi:hypothetical protein